MRFPLSTRPAPLARGCRECIATRGLRSAAHLLAICWVSYILLVETSFAQPPGTRPPSTVFDGEGDDGGTGGLRMKGFLMLDESGVPVMVPQMTYERWHDLESGVDGPEQSYAFESLEIVGTAENRRAELEVTLRFSVDISDGRSIPIPLRMGNFHRLSPPDVSGVDDHSMTVAPDNGGYVLWVRADKRREATLRMRMSASIEESTKSALQFRLPNVPSTVRLDVAGENVSPDVVGRGDEVLQTKSLSGRRSQLVVESGGGNFLLRWGDRPNQDDTTPQLEVESDVDVRWIAPEDQPTASVTLTVRNLHGSVSTFDVIFPYGAILLDSPILESSGQYLDVATLAGDETHLHLRFTIPAEEQKQRVDLTLELQLANTQASATSPLALQMPDVIGALRQRGEVHVSVGNDYRLRWLSRQWIRSISESESEDIGANRRYSFRYDRGGLILPIYLAAKQRQLRLASNTEIVLSDSFATLEMTIIASGQSFDGRGLNLDMRGWELRGVQDTETGQELDHYRNERFHEIEMNSGGADGSAPVRITAERAFAFSESGFELPLPLIVKSDKNQLMQTSTVVVRSVGRSGLVIDLSKSSGLDRLSRAADVGPVEPNLHRFQVLPADAAAVIAGSLVQQMPRIDLTSTASIQLDAGELRTSVRWTLTSLFDLEGRLPIDIPAEPVNATRTDPSRGDLERQVSLAGLRPWMVTVNDAPAELRHVEGSRYELVSDRLAEGTISVGWWNSHPVETNSADESLHWCVLPRPTVSDVSVQGPTRVSLTGDQAAELLGTAGESELVFDSLPREPVRVRMVPRSVLRRELSVQRAVLRTAVGRKTRYEQLLAAVSGGETLDVAIGEPGTDVKYEAFVDQQPASVRFQDNHLRVALPIDEESHSVDLRVWLAEPRDDFFNRVEPTLMVPVDFGRVYWQVVIPRDSHIVWAEPSLGRAMRWELDQWRMARRPIRDDQTLTAWVGAPSTLAMPTGNVYLYLGSDPGGFVVKAASRAQLWSIVSALVLAIATVLTYVPSARHPIGAIVAAIALAGLIAVAPDAAVLTGQFAMIALVLVVVMTSVRALMLPRAGSRVFRSGRVKYQEPSTRSIKVATRQHESQLSETEHSPPRPAKTSPAAEPTLDEPPVKPAAAASGSGVSKGSSKLPPTTEVTS